MAARRSSVPNLAANLKPVRSVDWPILAGGAVLAVAAGAAYGRTFSAPFQFDDMCAIVDNSTIRHWRTAFSPPFNTTASGRPILNFSLAINYAVSGTAVWSYHALNLAIHILAGLALFGIVRRTLAPRIAGPSASRIAFAASLLWILHPLQTESVTYIVQRAESLMGLFYLLTLYCFIRYASSAPRFGQAKEAKKSGRRGWAVSAILACLLGMATKEVMVSAPLIVLLYDRTFLAGGFREAWRRYWRIYGGLAATWLILPFLVFSAHSRGGTVGFGSGVSWWRYGLTQFPAILNYLRLSVWPRPLIFDYGTEWVSDLGAVWPSALIVTGLLGATAWALWRQSFGLKSLSFAGAWFFAILAPTSLVSGNRQTAAEHRMYLALIPLVVLAAIGIYRWLGRAALACCLTLAVGLFGLTWQRNEDYRSVLALWSDTVAKNPGNPWAHNNLGSALEKIPERLNDAIAQYETALSLKPDYAEAHSNLGSTWLKLPGRLDDAIAQCEEAIRLDPDLAVAHDNLGNAWSNVPGRLNDAIAQYEEALRLDPDSVETHNNLGNAFLKMPERLNDAIAQYEAALQLNPDSAEAHYNLGVGWSKQPGKLTVAMAQYEEAIRLQPDFALAHNNLATAWAKIPGHLNDTVAQFEEAVRLQPDNASFQFNLAIALLKSPGRAAEASAHLDAVVRLQPGNDTARQILAEIRAPARPAP